MDYHTLLIVLIAAFCLQALALTIAWYENRDEDGTREWAIAALCMAFGAILVLFLGMGASPTARQEPVIYSGITLIATGWMFLWAGARRFLSHRPFSLHYLGIFFVVFYLALFQRPFFDLPQGWLLVCLALVVTVASGLIISEFVMARACKQWAARLLVVCFGLTGLTWGLRGAVALSDLGQPLGSKLDVLVLFETILATVTVTFGMILLSAERMHAQLREQAYLDSLTGLYNRRAFHEASRALVASAERDGEPIALALLDMDHFKAINDNFGHGVGDKVLMRFANLAELTFRDEDVLARFGGEEFVVLLPGADAEQAMQALQRLRRRLETECIEYQGQCVPSTVSIGLSCRQGEKIDLHAMIEEADKALYDAKRAGRNRVILYHIEEVLIPG